MRSAAVVAGYLLATALIGFSGTRAAAQPIADHLKCYKVKDAQPKATYTADLGGLVAEPGCVIKVPGKLLCVDATKTNVTPTPPGGADNSGSAGRFLCYKLKCPKAALAPLQWHDQFGDRQLIPSTPKMVCAPEIVATSTTTSTTNSTTTTTLAALGAPCTGAAECASGFCADGVCCSAACTGACSACTAVKNGVGDGTCGPTLAGTDPDGDCTAMPASTCGTTGVCNGTGACELYAPSTVCAVPSCSGTVFTPAATCNGSGSCLPAPINCGLTAAPFCNAVLGCVGCNSNGDCPAASCSGVGNTIFTPASTCTVSKTCVHAAQTDCSALAPPESCTPTGCM